MRTRVAARRRAGWLGVALALTIGAASAAGAAQDDASADFASWLAEFKLEALAEGISPAVVEAATRGVKPVEKILRHDRKQAEFTITLAQYLGRVATPKNIAAGRAMRDKHRELLAKVAARYGVQPRFILAIWGIETRYGRIAGSADVIPALATLAFDRRRSAFFRNELLSALKMIDAGYIDLASMKGSWAGAMGQPQFIPSSYLAYAQDFDGDGRRDIWRNIGDVFASIANYLAQSGWSDDQTWGREVRLPDGFGALLPSLVDNDPSGCRAARTMTVAKPLDGWAALGLRRADGSGLPTRALKARLVLPDGAQGPAYLVYANYNSILRYNCAHHYAVTVGTLADKIAAR